jgi:hypothetical protein
LTATVPRILATILNGTIVAGMVVLLHRCRTARLVPAAHLHISYAKDIFAPVYDPFTEGLCDCGHADHANRARLAPPASSLVCWRRPCARISPLALLFRLQRNESPIQNAHNCTIRAVIGQPSSERSRRNAGAGSRHRKRRLRCAGKQSAEEIPHVTTSVH